MKKFLEAVPNTLILVGGIGLVILLLSPFLLEMTGGPPRQGAVTLHEDAESLPGLDEPAAAPSRISGALQVLPSPRLYNRYLGIALDDPLAELQARFELRQLSREGVTPRVFTAVEPEGIEYLQASFYQGALKKLVVVYPPREVLPEELAAELFAEFGEVPTWLRNREEELSRVGQESPELVERLLAYPTQRSFAWSDGENRVDATTYSRLEADNQYRCILAVQISASEWLKDYQAKRDAGIAVPLPEPTKPESDTAPMEPPLPPLR